MASRTFYFNLRDKQWTMSSMFSASLDLMLTFIFLLSACISILTSKLMRFFQLEPPSCQPGFESTLSYSLRSNELMKSLCNYHAKKLTTINNIAVDRQSVHVHNLCEDCVLLNFYSSDKSSRFSDHIFFKKRANESSEKSTDEEKTCKLCTYQKLNSFSKGNHTSPKLVNVEGDARSLQEDIGSDSGSADCSSLALSDRQQDSMRSCCFYCKELRRRNRTRNLTTERKFARSSAESLKDRSWDSLPTESENPFASRKEKKISAKKRSPKRYWNIDKVTKGSMSNGRLDATGEAGGLFEQRFHWTMLQQGEHIDRSTFYDDKFSDEGEALPLKFRTDSFTTSDIIVKYDTTFKTNSTSKKDGENATRLPRLDSKSEVLTKARQHENRMQDLEKAIKVEREAIGTFYEELERHVNASALAASETFAMIARMQEEKTSVQIEVLDKAEQCRHMLLADRVRQWRQQKLKREEFENRYKTGRMSLTKSLEKPVLAFHIGGSELNLGVKNYSQDSVATVDTISENLTVGANKVSSFKDIETPNTEKNIKLKTIRRQMNSLPQIKRTNSEANALRVPAKGESEKLWRKLLLVTERASNDEAIESGMTKEVERITESGDMEDGQSYESSNSIYPVKQQRNGEKSLEPLLDTPEDSRWASHVRGKKGWCSERAYSEDDASVLGFYFETEGDECWWNCKDLLNDKTGGPTNSATKGKDDLSNDTDGPYCNNAGST